MQLYRSFLTVSGLTFLSRVLGFLRDIFIAALLGTGPIADAFFVAFRLPNLFRRLFGEGAFNSAFIPLFVRRLEESGHASAGRFASEALSGLTSILLALSAAMMIAMPWLMAFLAPGFAADPAQFDLAVSMTQIMFPYLACMSLVALLSGVLNSLGRFIASSAISIVLNLTLIATVLIAIGLGHRNDPGSGIILSWGVFAAGLLQLLMLLSGTWRSNHLPRLVRPVWNDDMKQLVRLGIPGVIAGGVTQINILIGTVIASLQAGAVSHLYYADRLYELPLALVGIAIGVVLLPDIARHLRAGHTAAAADSQNRSIEFALLLTLPASAALIVIPNEVISVLFERGAFTAADVPATARALAFFAAGLPAFVLIKVFSAVFFANEDTATPMRFALVSLTLNTMGSAGLFFLFRQMGLMPHLGIAVASALGGWLNMGLLLSSLLRRGWLQPDARLIRSVPRMLLATALMSAALLFGADQLAALLVAGSGASKFPALALLVAVGCVSYFAAALALGAVPVRSLVRAVWPSQSA